mgnify:CR=1 FL=1
MIVREGNVLEIFKMKKGQTISIFNGKVKAPSNGKIVLKYSYTIEWEDEE